MGKPYKFDIKLDFKKSRGSYLFDAKRGKPFLDFFSFYSSLPLGYNHPVFSDKGYLDAVARTSHVKVANDALETDEKDAFVESFRRCDGMDRFKYFYFCCTGALGIESALKVAIDYRRCTTPVVISFKGDFHGINSWGFTSDPFPPIGNNIGVAPALRRAWPKVGDPGGIERYIRRHGPEQVAAVLIEPVQATFGDRHFPPAFFLDLRRVCGRHDIPLIFDEVQTGFGTTGRMWYFQHLDIEPDIVVFGKRAQVAGIMAKGRVGRPTFKSPVERLEVTFDGNLCDMIRCTYVLKAFEEHGILANVRARSDQLHAGLARFKGLADLRRQGLLMAFDLPNPELKSRFSDLCFERRLLVSPAAAGCVRIRPNLAVSAEEVDAFLGIVGTVMKELRLAS